MRERKFIIVKNDKPVIRVGYVLYHRDLLNKGERDNIVCGGGKWDIYPEEKKIIFWGSSDDYGKYNINGHDIIISSGLGTSSKIPRINNRPEISLIILKGYGK